MVTSPFANHITLKPQVSILPATALPNAAVIDTRKARRISVTKCSDQKGRRRIVPLNCHTEDCQTFVSVQMPFLRSKYVDRDFAIRCDYDSGENSAFHVRRKLLNKMVSSVDSRNGAKRNSRDLLDDVAFKVRF